MCVQTVDWHVFQFFFFSVLHCLSFFSVLSNYSKWVSFMSCTVTSVPPCEGKSHTGCSPGQCSVFHCCSWAAVPSPALSSGHVPLWALQETGDLCCGELTHLLLSHCWAPCIMGRWVCTYKYSPVDMYAYSILMMNACGWVLGAVGRIKHCKWVMMWWTGHINFLVTVFSSSNFLDAFSKDCTEVQNIAS